VADEPDVLLPGELIRITRASQNELHCRAAPRRLDEQHFQSILPIRRVRAEPGEIRTILIKRCYGPVRIRIDVPIQRSCPAGMQVATQRLQRDSACVAQHEIKSAETFRREIIDRLAGGETRERHGRVQIVEHADQCLRRIVEQQCGSSSRIGAIRSDDCGICARDLALRTREHRSPLVIQNEVSVRQIEQIAIGSVVRGVALKERNTMSAAHKRTDQAAPECRVPIPPG
jgi:hypothetical protein